MGTVPKLLYLSYIFGFCMQRGGVGWRGVAWGGVGWGAIVLLGIAQESCAKALTCCCAELIFQRRGLSHGMVDGALAFISCTRHACDAKALWGRVQHSWCLAHALHATPEMS